MASTHTLEDHDLRLVLQSLTAIAQPQPGFLPNRQEYIVHLDQLSAQADRLGLDGLQDVILLLREALANLDDDEYLAQPFSESLGSWPAALDQYLQHPTAETSRSQLLNALRSPLLDLDLTDADCELLEQLLIPEFHLTRSASIAEELGQLVDDIESAEGDSQLLFEQLETLAETAANDGYQGLEDVCLYCQEILLELTERDAPPSQEQASLALQWPGLIHAYLRTPDDPGCARALINFISNPLWEMEFPGPDMRELETVLSEKLVQALSSSSRNQLISLIDELDDASGDTQQLVDTLERLAECADLNGLLGFQDICLFCQELLLDLADQPAISPAQAERITHWPILARNYIETPDDCQAAETLIQYLQSPLWPAPLAESEADILRSLLIPDDQETPLQNADEESTVCGYPLGETPAFYEAELNPSEFETQISQYHAPFGEASPDYPTGLESSELETQISQYHGPFGQDETQTQLSPNLPPFAITEISEELIEMMANEMLELSASCKHLFEQPVTSTLSDLRHGDDLATLATRTERYGYACQAAGLQGLSEVMQQVHSNLLQLELENTDIAAQQSRLLKTWPLVAIDYLEALGDPDAGDALARLLADPRWPVPLESNQCELLARSLAAMLPVKESALQQPQLMTATEEDVSLALPDDLHQELLDGLLQELPRQTEDLSRAIQSLASGSGSMAEVSDAQRIAHTIKGAANTVGVKGVAILTHHLEDLLEGYSKASRIPSSAVADKLLLASDCLEEMSDYLLGQAGAPRQALTTLQTILNLHHQISTQGIPADDEAIPMATAQIELHGDIQEIESPQASASNFLRVPASMIDHLLRLAGEATIMNGQLQEKLSRTRGQVKLLARQSQVFQSLIGDLEQQVDIRGMEANRNLEVGDNSGFDPLELVRYNELHTITHRLVEASADTRELGHDIDLLLGELDELVIRQNRLQRENQENVLNTRMVSVQSIIPRLQRTVRQTCKLTGKKARLMVHGENTQIDSDVLAQLTDPLMHVLRNAVDHGIEAPQDRNQFSKPDEGQIKLSFTRKGNSVLVSCEDDGSGLDYKLIQETARHLNMLGEEDELDEEDLNRLLMHPGFSTRKDASQTSGRGIGMDVVHTQLSHMKGSVRIRSRLLKGCTVELQFPVTLLSTHALVVRHEQTSLAISSRGIEQILFAHSDEIVHQDGEYSFLHEQRNIRARMLEELLNLPLDPQAHDRRLGLLVKDEEIEEVILIDDIQASKEMIVKSLGHYLPGLVGLIGATIMGEGEVAPVLDLPEIIRLSDQQIKWSAPVRADLEQRVSLPTALIVDDSISTRRALSQFMRDTGFEVQTARDGLEAYVMIEKEAPDIILLDLEMPRMNGLELARHLRSRAETQQIPIIMITSRTTEKHRIEARAAGINVYLSKPYSEDVLLEHVHAALQ